MFHECCERCKACYWPNWVTKNAMKYFICKMLVLTNKTVTTYKYVKDTDNTYCAEQSEKMCFRLAVLDSLG